MADEKRVIVTGDILMEWLFAQSHMLHSTGALLDPKYYVRCYPDDASSMRLAALIGRAAATEPALAKTVSPTMPLPRPMPGQPPFWHAYLVCAQFPTKSPPELEDDKTTVWRLKEQLGTDRQRLGDSSGTFPKLISDEMDDGNADLIVVEDEYKGFAECEGAWPRSLRAPSNDAAWALFHWVRPNFRKASESSLWCRIRDRFEGRIAIVVTINDLRISPMRISRGLTWERAIEDLDGEIRNVWKTELAACAYLIVSFYGAGAMVFARTGTDSYTARLFFDPERTQETWRHDYPGYMLGFTACLTASVALQLLRSMDDLQRPGRKDWPGLDVIAPGIIPGLAAAHELQRGGFHAEARLDEPEEYGDTPMPRSLSFPIERLEDVLRPECRAGRQPASGHSSALSRYVDRELPSHFSGGAAKGDAHGWKILRDELGGDKEMLMLAKRIVERGTDEIRWRFPVAKFGQLFVTDRAEIESYSAIGALMMNYMAVSRKAAPLSIAAFGLPGSGKSFGIQAVAEQVATTQPLESLTFNLSQVSSPEAINGALHQVRDVGLSGAMPLVFWDEFDTALNGADLGWLRYFLSPMEDGKFQAGPFTHSIGRAIFVFAGATHETMESFAKTASTRKGKETKALDFVSRLKGYVDVPGLNHPDRSAIDPSIALRRAVLLHSFLKDSAGSLVQTIAVPGERPVKRINIDTGLVHAFLRIPQYRYAARSMKSIVNMSAISGSAMFERSSLAPAEQLSLHVDPAAFLDLIATAPRWMEGSGDRA